MSRFTRHHEISCKLHNLYDPKLTRMLHVKKITRRAAGGYFRSEAYSFLRHPRAFAQGWRGLFELHGKKVWNTASPTRIY